MTKRIVLINGAPGSGKTTFVQKLKMQLQVPIIEKDSIKEFYFDYVGTAGMDHSRALGTASIEAMYALAHQLLTVTDSVILENSFNADLAPSDLSGLAKGDAVDILEVYCTLDEHERLRRFTARALHDRHVGHSDMQNISEAAMQDHFRALEIGDIIRVDMTEYDHARDEAVIEKIRNFIGGDNNETN